MSPLHSRCSSSSSRPRLELLEDRCLLSGGELDPTFGTGGKVTTAISALGDFAADVALQTNGKIIVAGSTDTGFRDINGASYHDFALVRYNTNGSLDSTFGVGGKQTTNFSGRTSTRIGSIALQADGKIVAAGEAFTNTGGSWNWDIALARYNANGTLDKTFEKDGMLTFRFSKTSYELANYVAIQADGKILVMGYTTYPGEGACVMLRYNSNGTLDSTFGNGGKVIAPASPHSSIVLQPDGKIVVAGAVSVFRGYDEFGDPMWRGDFAVSRYNPNGSLDGTFGGGDGLATTTIGADVMPVPNAGANGVALQGDGKIVLAGGYYYDLGDDTGNEGSAFARYNVDGSLDPTFGGDGIVTVNKFTYNESEDPHTTEVAIQANGKIVGAGRIHADFSVLSFNPDGSVDSTFGSSGIVVTDFGRVEGVSGIAIQTDGKLVMAGSYYTIDPGQDTSDFAVARYLGDEEAGVGGSSSSVQIPAGQSDSSTSKLLAPIGLDGTFANFGRFIFDPTLDRPNDLDLLNG